MKYKNLVSRPTIFETAVFCSMIILACIALILAGCNQAKATDFPGNYATASVLTNISITTSNKTNFIYVENNNQHTIQIFGSTNGANQVIATTLDGTNFIPRFTNNWANTNNLTFETNFSGKWQQFRVTSPYTNGTYTVNYLGTR